MAWKPLYNTLTWKSWSKFVKCFGLEITEPNVYFVTAYLKREIFPDIAKSGDMAGLTFEGYFVDAGTPGGVGIPGGRDGRGGGGSLPAPALMVDAVEEWLILL